MRTDPFKITALLGWLVVERKSKAAANFIREGTVSEAKQFKTGS